MTQPKCSGWPQVSSVQKGCRSHPFDKLGMNKLVSASFARHCDPDLIISLSWTKPVFPWDNSHVPSADTPDLLLHKLCSLSGSSNSPPLKSLPSTWSSMVSVCPSTQTLWKHMEQGKSSRIQHNSSKFSLHFEAAVLQCSACSPLGNVAPYSWNTKYCQGILERETML